MPGTAARTAGPGRLLLYALAAVASVLALIWLWEGAFALSVAAYSRSWSLPLRFTRGLEFLLPLHTVFAEWNIPVVQKLAGRATLATVAAEPVAATIVGAGEAEAPPPVSPASVNDNSFGGGAAAEVARADDPAVQVNEVIAAQIAEFDDVGRRAGQLVEAAASKSDAREDLRVALDRESSRLATGTVRFVDTPYDDLGQQMSE